LIVINKPGAIPCHPLRAGEPGTIMNAVVARYPEIASAGDNPLEGGLVHRLDNGTSGALLIVKNSEAFAKLRAAIRAGRIARHYQALVAGRLDRPLELTAPIAHHRKNPRKMTQGIDSSRRKLAGRRALTMVEPIPRVGPYTLVAVRPQSGSRHQIRVHLANAGFPIVGDVLYGGPVDTTLGEGRFWLHLSRIEFESPSSGHVTVSAP